MWTNYCSFECSFWLVCSISVIPFIFRLFRYKNHAPITIYDTFRYAASDLS